MFERKGRLLSDAIFWMAFSSVLVFLQGCSVFAMSDKWLPIQEKDLMIEPGSALDFSKIFDQTEIRERIAITSDGHLGRNDIPGDKRRFFCASLNFSPPHGKFPSHSESDSLVIQMRKRGYNLARFHFVDATLMAGRKFDFDYDREQVDRFHYLLYALKRNGIRWMMDAATSDNGAFGDVKPHRWVNKHNLKLRVYFDDRAKSHWQRMVDTILCVQNKYTGSVILHDPALLTVTLFNESGLGFLSRKGYPDVVKEEFRKWLKQKNNQAIGRVPGRWEVSDDAALMQQFFGAMEHKTAEWMSDYLLKKEFEGLICAYNNGKSLQAAASRINLKIVAGHAYHDHPSNFVKSGSGQNADSSIDGALGYVRTLATTRFSKKPFIVEEYDHPYWNPYRREAGVALPAFAAFQDWDVICRYTNPVELNYTMDNPPRSRAIHPFGIGMDPVAIAGETLAVLLFRRADVKPAKKYVSISFGPEEAYGNAGGTLSIPSELSLIGLLTGIGVDWQNSADGKIGFQLVDGHGRESHLNSLVKNNISWEKVYRKLVDQRVISTARHGIAEQDLFKSDTGQIIVEPKEKRMTVNTPKSQVAVFEKNESIELDNLKIKKADGGALVSLMSLDGRPIAGSNRLLLIVATDAINSGAAFSQGRKVLLELGSLPILVRPVKMTLEIEGILPENLTFYPLKLNGARKKVLPAKSTKHDNIELVIDTGNLEDGPSIFFELVRASR